MRLGWIAITLVGIGCSDDDDDGHDDELGPMCQEIVDACHEPGEAGDAASEACHETGHEGDEAVCELEHDVCIDTCENATV
jgi:hypothetical protein